MINFVNALIDALINALNPDSKQSQPVPVRSETPGNPRQRDK